MRSRDLLAIALLVLAAGGCTEFDDTVVVAISTLAPSLADSDLAPQAVEVDVTLDGGTIQNVHFGEVTILALTLDEFEKDMTFGVPDCEFFDAWTIPVIALGKCASGVIVDGDKQNHTFSLLVQIKSMTVQRVPPLVLSSSGDWDVDGVDNADDNCVLIDNPDQTDTGMKGYGDACTIFDLSAQIPRLDSDADSIPDSSDNCPYTPNPGQEDAGFSLGGNITVPDGIGDACRTEEATVTFSGTETIDLSLGPITAELPLRRVRWLTVDIRDEDSLTDCWAGGSCVLKEDQVKLCLDEAGGLSCPDTP